MISIPVLVVAAALLPTAALKPSLVDRRVELVRPCAERS